MLKLLEVFIEAVFWLMAFLSPALTVGIAAGLVYLYDKKLSSLSIVLLIIGVISGIAFAEHVRRKYGCSNYFSRLISIPPEKENNPEN